MKTIAAALIIGLILATPAVADDDAKRGCSVRALAGNWVFATEVGQFTGLGPITALGTLNIERDGTLAAEFDFTVGDLVFGPDNTASGSITVDADCRGTLTFTDSTGQSRTDSIVVVDRSEIWGMSQSPGVLWTYRAKRIGSR